MKIFSTVGALVLTIALLSCSEQIPVSVQPPPLPSISCSGYVYDGYCDKVSYYPGEKLKAFINGTDEVGACSLTIYSINGDSAFSVRSPITRQTIQSADPSSTGYGYSVTVEFQIPTNISSGVYMIQGTVPFIVKPRATVDVLFVYPSNTANAYCGSGGKSFYSTDRATTISYHRPMGIDGFSEAFLKWIPGVKDFSYGIICDTDVEDYMTLSACKILCIVGHSEYWTRTARENFDKFVDSGNNAVVLSGNSMWWQVRYSADRSQIICYKDWNNDPVADRLLKTVQWVSPELQYTTISSIGADFSLGGYGLKSDSGWDGYKIIRPSSPILDGLNLHEGDIIHCPTVEYDGAPILGTDDKGYPILDLESLKAYKGEIIAFDKGYRGKDTYGTLLIYQRSATSGVIINTGSTDWCSQNGIGGTDGVRLKKITLNAINKLLAKQQVFCE